MISIAQRTRPDSIGSSVWPAGRTGIASLMPTRRGHVLVLAPLIGELAVGGLTLPPGAKGVYPMPEAVDPLPVMYRFTHEADPARVVFVTR